MDAYADQVDDDGRRLMVRNGYHEKRQVTTAAGSVQVCQPRADDRRVDENTGKRQRFASAILPRWTRKSAEVSDWGPSLHEVLGGVPLFYLRGLSTNDFGPALEQFLGNGHGLSASAIARLTTQCQAEATAFNQRSLAGVDYVYMWADGIHLKVRLDQDKVCLLVLIGVRRRC